MVELVALQQLEGNLLSPRPAPLVAAYGEDSDEEDDAFFLTVPQCAQAQIVVARARVLRVVSCFGGPLECFVCLLTLAVVVISILVIVGLNVNWGKAAYDKNLFPILDQFDKEGWKLTSACLYKQYNNGARSSQADQLALTDRQEGSKKYRSPDILFYHHQGNLLELTSKNNDTKWLQITFSESGMAWRYTPVPLMIDVLRYTKQCFWKCGTVSRKHANVTKFKGYMEIQRHRHYNGFLLNCLQFSQQLFDALEPDNVGCAPAEFVNRAEMSLPPYSHKSPEATDRTEEDDKRDAELNKEADKWNEEQEMKGNNNHD